MTAYRPQSNGRVERLNKTIVARLRHYVVKHQADWDQFMQPLAYVYNGQVYRSTGTTPFNLVLSCHLPDPVVSHLPSKILTNMLTPPEPHSFRERFLQKLDALRTRSD